MSIFGDLAELSLPEILNMVAKRTGQLELTQLPDNQVIILNLSNEYLKGCVINGQLVNDPLVVRDKLARVISETRGQFEFHKCGVSNLQGHLSLGIPQLLIAIAAQVDEISAYQHHFAHPQTRFQCLANIDIWLDEEIYLFLEKARKFLLQGIDAQTLAQELNLSVEQVQLHFYKLRTLGQITPIRAFEKVPPIRQIAPATAVPSTDTIQVKTATSPAKSVGWGMGLASKLLTALLRPIHKPA
jgi:Domain of unknown function (DUF4388)